MNSNKKQVDFNAQDLLLQGVNIMADAVKSTLGPKGRNVLLQTIYGTPHLTKDGVTVAKNITLKDPVQNIAVQVLKQAAAKVVQEAGDGTTTAIVLAQAILQNAYKYIASGASPVLLKEGIEQAAAQIVKQLLEQSISIKDDWDQVCKVATISANNDSEIGSLITEALQKAGQYGVVAVQDSKSTDTYVSTTQGYSYDRGYASPYFVTDTTKLTSELENPLILVTTEKVRSTGDLLPALELAANYRRPLLVIADDVEAQALSMLVVNKMQANIISCATKAPGFGDNRSKTLNDICILTGATLISDALGKRLTQVSISDLGSAEKVISTRSETTIINGKSDVEKVRTRIDEIKAEMEQVDSEWEKERLKERLGKFVGSVSIINVGAHTEIELKEKKDRIDDALQASRAAIERGILPGGGVTLYNTSVEYKDDDPEDVKLGMKILHNSLASPIDTICKNAGKDPGEVKTNIIHHHLLPINKDLPKFSFGYDARGDRYADMLKLGIIDPTKVVISALEAATSVATALIMTDVVVTDLEGEVQVTDINNEMF